MIDVVDHYATETHFRVRLTTTRGRRMAFLGLPKTASDTHHSAISGKVVKLSGSGALSCSSSCFLELRQTGQQAAIQAEHSLSLPRVQSKKARGPTVD